MSAESEFKAGDRVRVKPAQAEWYTLPLRKWVAAGRPAVVKAVFVQQGCVRTVVTVEFEAKRKPKYRDSLMRRFSPFDLEMVE